MMPMTAAIARTRATPMERLIGAIIDGLIMVPVYIVIGLVIGLTGMMLSSAFIASLISGVITSAIGAAWFLMRDALGISIGKKILGLEVVSKNGAPASQDQLKKRNFTLAGGQACAAIPFVGWIATLGINLYEAYMIFTQGERYGDQMADTIVVKKA